jgi:hypothetical protein
MITLKNIMLQMKIIENIEEEEIIFKKVPYKG